MQDLGYIRVEGNSVVVDAAKRDWTDYDHAKHIAYHRSVLGGATAPFFVLVDATAMPARALLHMRFFYALCTMARSELKTQLGGCTVKGAPVAVRGMFSMLVTCGAIPAATAHKVFFEE